MRARRRCSMRSNVRRLSINPHNHQERQMDHLGYRMKFGVLGPSTNTIVQPDFDDMRPAGVTNHYSRIIIPDMKVESNEDFLALVEAISGNTMDAAEVLKSCEMQYLVMGMSAVTFWNGRDGASKY